MTRRKMSLSIVLVLVALLVVACGGSSADVEADLPEGLSLGMWYLQGDDTSLTFLPDNQLDVVGDFGSYRLLDNGQLVVSGEAGEGDFTFSVSVNEDGDRAIFNAVDYGEEMVFELKHRYERPVTKSRQIRGEWVEVDLEALLIDDVMAPYGEHAYSLSVDGDTVTMGAGNKLTSGTIDVFDGRAVITLEAGWPTFTAVHLLEDDLLYLGSSTARRGFFLVPADSVSRN